MKSNWIETNINDRQIGQNAPEEIAARDLKRELELREQKYFASVEKCECVDGLDLYLYLYL